ncbi:MAG: hypothetical protein ABIH46_06130, partial [Chloroflexota bacterium]
MAVARGDRLLAETVSTYRHLLRQDSALALAVISLGGDSGIDTSSLKAILGVSQQEVSGLVRGLAQGGTIEEVTDRRLTVQPEPLRFAAVKDQFFDAPGSPSVWDVVERLPVPSSAILPLVGAAHRGARLDHLKVERLLSTSGNREALLAYASLGKSEAKFCLQAGSHLEKEIAQEVLYFAPDIGLPLLLAHAVGDNRPLHSSPDHPLRLIQDYVQASRQTMERRRAVLAATR